MVGDGGRIYTEGDSHALAAQLTALLQDAPHYAAISAQARQRVLTHYTQQALAQRYADIYRDMHAGRL